MAAQGNGLASTTIRIITEAQIQEGLDMIDRALSLADAFVAG